ncbi:MAG TPA: acyl-CoA dehydrogenase family protein [Acidimicrobiia bacterium]|nr:acyl-CoA dehydrogenase family protein [Acidimicrobiia bacterium]
MDFNDTTEEAAWRAEFRAWLEENAPKVVGQPPEHEMEVGGGDYVERAKRWQAMKFDAGLARITWEPEYGGRNGTTVEQIIFGQEEGRFTVPNEAFIIGLGMIAPTLRAVGTPAQKERYLTKLLRGEEIWSQLFSEPGAGSDVASLATTATRDGDEWVINGQKVWTSGAQISDFGEIVCRTNPEAEKHKGITAFIVDLRAPGVTIKPLKQMNGGAGFNEVFFDDVRVPHDHVLGDVNEGWTVAITTLMNERVAIGSGGGGGGRGSVQQLISLAQERGVSTDARVRQQLADLYTKTRIQKFLSMRTLTAATKGKIPGPEGSIGKLLGGRIMTQLGDLAVSLAGPDAVAGQTRFAQTMLAAPAGHIAGGSDEVMKNIIGERVLGLPGEPRPDKGVAWRDVPR